MTGSRIAPWHTLARWLPSAGDVAATDWPTVRLGDLLTRREQAVSTKAFGEFTPITIRFSGDIEPRDRTEAFKGAMFAVRPGDLVFSKIDVRNGAIGLLPETVGPAVVTSEYPVYTPDPEQVEAAYLALLLRTAPFLALLKQAASGTSGRKRVRPEDFEALDVPLPDVPTQRALVDAYAEAYAEADRLDAEAERAERLAVHAFEAALGLAPPPDLPRRRSHIARWQSLDRWSHEGALHAAFVGDATPDSDFDLVLLEDVAKVSYGLQKSPANRPGKHPRPYLRVANVQRGTLDLSEIKYLDVPDEDMPKYALQKGDILICEGNSADLVGRGAIWQGEIPECVHQNHVLRVRIHDQASLLPEFVMACINGPTGQAYFRSKAKRTTNLASINSKEVGAMPLPLPGTIEQQQQILQDLIEAEGLVQGQRRKASARRAAARAAFAEALFG